MSFDEWCDIMSHRRNACDELFLFMLCELHNRHAVVFTNNWSWSTVHTEEPMTEDQIYAACDLHLVFLGQGVYGKLMLKPSALGENSVPSPGTDNVIVNMQPSQDSEIASMEQGITMSNQVASSVPEPDTINNNSTSSLNMDISPESPENTSQPTPINPWIPPIKPFVLPLKFLVVEYLCTCSSPLLNPVILPSVVADRSTVSTKLDTNSNNNTSDSNEKDKNSVSTEDVKSVNGSDLSVSLDKILKQTCSEWNYMVELKVMTQTEINQATRVVPHWTKIDPYSSLEEIGMTSSSENSEVEKVLELDKAHTSEDDLEPKCRMSLHP